MLRKACPDLAVKVHYNQEKESRPQKKECLPKPTKADGIASVGTNMVFVLPLEFYAPDRKELPVAQLDFEPRLVIFEKHQEKNYKMLVDTGAKVNIMPYSVLRQLGRSAEDLIKTNVTMSDFNGQASEALGVLNVDLTVGSKIILTSFFIVSSKSTYTVLLGRDWIHANC
jgi:hypothetical protein